MSLIAFHKVSFLPGVFEPNAFYYMEYDVEIEGQTRSLVEGYLTSSTGEARSIGNVQLTADIAAVVARNEMSLLSSIRIAEDIQSRDEMGADNPMLTKLILVLDATGDPTVDFGSALYVYNGGVDRGFIKLSEYESMDVVLTWEKVQGRPSSSPTAIDEAVNRSHVHDNKVVLDKFTESPEGKPLYAGAALGGGDLEWAEVSW